MFKDPGVDAVLVVTLPSTAAETANAQCTGRCATVRGHRLNTSIVLAAVHGLSGPFRAVSAVEPSPFRPLPPPPPPPPPVPSPSLISNLASVDVKQNGHGQGHAVTVVFLACNRWTPPCLRPTTFWLLWPSVCPTSSPSSPASPRSPSAASGTPPWQPGYG